MNRVRNFFRKNEVDQVFAYEMLQKFAFSLISIFIPIYIAREAGLVLALQYVGGVSLFFAAAAIPVSWIIARIGFKHSLVVSYVFYLPSLLAFQLVERGTIPLDFKLVMASGFLLALGKAFHWIALHSEFATDSSEDERGKDSGRLLGLPRISKAVAPFAGGVIMASLGFGGLVSVTVVFLLLSVLPLMASSDHRDPKPYSLKSILTRKHLRYGALFYLRGLGIAAGYYLFPLFVATVVSKGGGEVNAGLVSSLANIGMAAFTILLGAKADQVDTKEMVFAGAVLSGALFVARGLVITPTQAFIVSLTAGPAFMMYYVPIYSELANAAEDEDVLEFYAFREVVLGVSRVMLYGFTAYAFLAWGMEAAFRYTFYITGVATALIFVADRYTDASA
ncbi:MAG: MFS transporter [Candidatus Nanosalina sp.]